MEVEPPNAIIESMKRIEFANSEYYHIYNRGVDKRNIFESEKDIERFIRSLLEFNQKEAIGSIHENSFKNKDKPKLGGSTSKSDGKLVNFVCYCLNSNHFHLLLEQVADNGIEKFMQRLGTGYTMYFNLKHKRSGSLFQGRFKAVHVDSNEYLLHLSAYINLNNKVHKNNTLYKSSLDEYKTGNSTMCKFDIIMDQFKDYKDYEKYLNESLEFILENKDKQKELEALLFE